jgi:2-polyprenyl-3-methyl-5-hydroxy-6-metoxy-1,4-benzoquinol methylase
MNDEIEFDSNNNILTDKQFWNRFWGTQSLSFVNVQKLSARQKEFITYLKQLRFNQNRRILEIGVGPGVKLFELAMALDLDPGGLDFSGRACQMARQNAAANSIAAVIVQGDIFSPPFSPGAYGIVLSQGVIEHFINPLEILRPCSELVAPGGYLITTIPNIAGFCGVLMKIIDLESFNKHVAIRLADLRSMYEALGHEVVFAGTLGGFYIPYYPRNKSLIKWVFWGLLRKSLPALMRRIKFNSAFFSSELLIIGRKTAGVNPLEPPGLKN